MAIFSKSRLFPQPVSARSGSGPSRLPVAGGKPVYWWPRRMHGPSRGAATEPLVACFADPRIWLAGPPPPTTSPGPASAQAEARTRFSGINDGDGLDLDHKMGSGETGDADGRAGRGRHPEIAHADVGALLELVEVGDKGVGLDDVGPSGAGRLETSVEVLEGRFHLRPHVSFADA